MITIYIPKETGNTGGGFTFLRNFKKGMSLLGCKFTHEIEKADLIFVPGVTMVDPSVLHKAKQLGKPIVFRVDNVPRKSRNRRSTPHERMKEYGELADIVVYQSKYASDYCSPLSGEGIIIYNGVDQSIFYPPADDKRNGNKYLFAYHGKNEMKGFWTAHLKFQQYFKKNKEAIFTIINDFGKDQEELANAKYDFWNGEAYIHLPVITDPKKFADLLRMTDYLIYPSIGDASPNMVLEARACNVKVIDCASLDMAGSQELLDPNLDTVSIY